MKAEDTHKLIGVIEFSGKDKTDISDPRGFWLWLQQEDTWIYFFY
jgi:hypothetical protein